MPQINLTTLSGQELRQRLDASRARGNAALAYEILREMATRRAAETGRRSVLRRRAAEPRIVDVDLGDPLEKDDDLPAIPHWRAPEPPATEAATHIEAPDPRQPRSDAAESEVAPERPPKPTRRRTSTTEQALDATAPAVPDDLPRFRVLDAPPTLRDPAADSEPAGLRLDAPPPHHKADSRPSRHILRVAAGFAVGIASGAALGWFAADLKRDAPAPTVAPVAMARGAARPPPTAVLEVVAEPAASPVEVAIAPPGAVSDIVPRTEPEPAPVPEGAAATAEPTAVAAEDACARESTRADRAICADAALQRLQVDLRRAYADALDAHEDRALLRERQLAWREARNEVDDPARLARIYEQRIRKLQAAAAEARAMR